MRILIVHNSLNDSQSVSGVLKYYAFFANEWTAQGHPTDFAVAKAGWPQLRQLAPGARLLNSDGIFNATRYLSKTWLYFPAFAYRMLTAHWMRLPGSYDVVYASWQFVVEVYCARILARRSGAKFVAKVQHVLLTQPGRRGLLDRLFLWSERQSAKWIHRDAGLLLCLSNTVARDYEFLEQSLGLPPKPKQAIGCGIDLRAFERLSSNSKKYDGVFLGRLHEHKGVFDLPKVWQQVVRQRPEARLLVIGQGPHRLRTEEMFQRMGLSHSVTFTGGVGEEEKNQLLAEARVGISLSTEEGWGLAVNEFLATGLPVIAYDLPVFHEVFPDQLLLVKRGDVQGFAAQWIALLADPAKQSVLGETGRKFVQRYDYRHLARVELEALQKLFVKPGA